MYTPVITNSHYLQLRSYSLILLSMCNHSFLTQHQLEQILKSMTMIVPMIIRHVMIRVNDRLAIMLDMTTERQ